MSGRAGSTVAQQSRDTPATRTRQVATNGQGKSTAQARRALRAAELLEHVAQGMTIVEAAKAVGVSRKTGQEMYHEALAAVTAQQNELRQHLIAQDLESLRLLVRRFMGLALGSGDSQAARVVLGALDRRAKLLGLDAAVKLEISNQRIDAVVGQIVELVETDGSIPPELLQIEVGPGEAE